MGAYHYRPHSFDSLNEHRNGPHRCISSMMGEKYCTSRLRSGSAWRLKRRECHIIKNTFCFLSFLWFTYFPSASVHVLPSWSQHFVFPSSFVVSRWRSRSKHSTALKTAQFSKKRLGTWKEQSEEECYCSSMRDEKLNDLNDLLWRSDQISMSCRIQSVKIGLKSRLKWRAHGGGGGYHKKVCCRALYFLSSILVASTIYYNAAFVIRNLLMISSSTHPIQIHMSWLLSYLKASPA